MKHGSCLFFSTKNKQTNIYYHPTTPTNQVIIIRTFLLYSYVVQQRLSRSGINLSIKLDSMKCRDPCVWQLSVREEIMIKINNETMKQTNKETSGLFRILISLYGFPCCSCIYFKSLLKSNVHNSFCLFRRRQ